MNRRRPGLSRRVLPLVVGLILAATSLSTAAPAGAAGNRPPVTTSSEGCQPVNNQATCISGVTFTWSDKTGTTSVLPKDWKPPACWFEPSLFTPTILEIAYLFVGPLLALLTGEDTGTKDNFHDGEKGSWWGLVYNPQMPDAQTQCPLPLLPLLVWVPDTQTPPQTHVTAALMAAAAANLVKVIPPTLVLQPGAGNQVVNLPTLMSVGGGFQRKWVTADLKVDGYDLAATSIATPASITVDAGTSNASPSSCTYTLTPDGSANPVYQVDPKSTSCSDGSSGANAGIIYRRPTAAGTTYPLTATVTWTVTWTDTDNPNDPPQTDPPLKPLTLTTPVMPVTVNEVETINH